MSIKSRASTIRRDVVLLNGRGRLAQAYDGAMAMGANPEASLEQRTREAFEQKHAVAGLAATVIRTGETSSSTPSPRRVSGPRAARF